ncbi:hypothetical protein CFC21_057298 [Triticum aestivum]|uniref:EF-hand domain-containing protein n=3 Tax=Triticum TaxID=4564 RepID=A0A9R0WBR3_TRITD|nr:hypothetical protein CFC21_057298 [Triticum aestivum]VAI04340.1 unnamed protein product [Triticum turgidum subsp. durum]
MVVPSVFAAFDKDGDGKVSDDVRRRCLREAFGMYGSSSTEDTTTTIITPASLRRTLSRLGSHELGVEECRAICRFDLDGDGKLSFDEFRVMMMA